MGMDEELLCYKINCDATNNIINIRDVTFSEDHDEKLFVYTSYDEIPSSIVVNNNLTLEIKAHKPKPKSNKGPKNTNDEIDENNRNICFSIELMKTNSEVDNKAIKF